MSEGTISVIVANVKFRPGLRSFNRKIRGYSQNKSKLSVHLTVFGGGQRTSPNYSHAVFWHNQGGGLCEKKCVCLFKKKNIGMFTHVIYLLLIKTNNYLYFSFDITSSLVYENKKIMSTQNWRSHETI